MNAAERVASAYAVLAANTQARLSAADKLEAAVDAAQAGLQAIERECSISRVRKQAALRATNNGLDPSVAAEAAESFLHAGESHERAVTLAAGEYRRSVS
jgi:hypothetical protein